MVGIVGVIFTLIAYYFINIGKWGSETLSYVLLNLFGSCFLMFSLMFSWNLASVLIEIAWITISLIGLVRYIKMDKVKKKKKSKPKNIIEFPSL